MSGPRPPRSGLDRYGNRWLGSSVVPARRRVRGQRSWRDWYRETFLLMWRRERGSAAADADRGAA